MRAFFVHFLFSGSQYILCIASSLQPASHLTQSDTHLVVNHDLGWAFAQSPVLRLALTQLPGVGSTTAIDPADLLHPLLHCSSLQLLGRYSWHACNMFIILKFLYCTHHSLWRIMKTTNGKIYAFALNKKVIRIHLISKSPAEIRRTYPRQLHWL